MQGIRHSIDKMQIPTQMRAMESASKGMANLKPVATRSVPWPPPTADSSDVLVKVEYTALNPIDWYALRGVNNWHLPR